MGAIFQQLFFLLAGVVLILVLSVRFKIHPFFSLIFASLVAGVGFGIPVPSVLATIRDGFGHIMKSIALIIVFGTTLGMMLERTRRTEVLAAYILKLAGPRHSAIAMNITGFIVGMPIFCDSGFIVLSSLNKNIATRANMSIVTIAVSLACGLYSVHCLIPPHPGASAAASMLQADFGKMILVGTCVAIPASIVGWVWTRYATRAMVADVVSETQVSQASTHGPLASLLPVLVPIALIAQRSFLPAEPSGMLQSILIVAGDPVAALIIGIILCTFPLREHKNLLSSILRDSVERSGSILVIIGAGGGFGAVLAAGKLGEQFSQSIPLETMGILFPFLLAAMLKTAQGSSTVAIITSASIALPLLPALGLDSENGRMLCVLAMGAGSMMVSHVNDAYFWVIANFENISMRHMLKVHTTASLFMALTALLMVYILSIFIY